MKTIKFRENPSPEELLKQLLGDSRRLQDFHGVIVRLETLSNPSFDLVELCGILECAKGSIESIVEANGLQGSPISRVELQQSVLGGGGGVRTDKRSGEVDVDVLRT